MADIRVIESEPQGRSVQSTLKDVLAEAKAGKISAVAIAIVYRDGVAGRVWSELPSVATMIGSVDRLRHRLNLVMDEDE